MSPSQWVLSWPSYIKWLFSSSYTLYSLSLMYFSPKYLSISNLPCISFLIFLLSLPSQRMLLLWGKYFCQTYSRCPVNICWMNGLQLLHICSFYLNLVLLLYLTPSDSQSLNDHSEQMERHKWQLWVPNYFHLSHISRFLCGILSTHSTCNSELGHPSPRAPPFRASESLP